jgi:hypothetical protein
MLCLKKQSHPFRVRKSSIARSQMEYLQTTGNEIFSGVKISIIS